MDIYANNRPFVAAGGLTVADAIDALQSADPDRLIVALRLDGAEVGQADLEDVLKLPLAEPGRLDVEYDSAGKLTAQALGEAALMLEPARDDYVAIATLLACGRTGEAMERLNDCFGLWNTVEQALRQSRAGGVDFDAPLAHAERPSACIERLGAVLRAIHEALGRRDFVEVADLVEADLLAVTDAWQAMLVAAQRRLLG
ncbi:MAG: hypothetical protein GX591_01170 [Planctomycetes bacterium]|nr:hypothetical protein [Planctomycetota bacterium]